MLYEVITLVYWFIRFLLGIGITILAIIFFGLLIMAIIVVFIIIDGIVYFLLSTFISEPLSWILLSMLEARYKIAPGCSIPPYWKDGMSTKSNLSKG